MPQESPEYRHQHIKYMVNYKIIASLSKSFAICTATNCSRNKNQSIKLNFNRIQ